MDGVLVIDKPQGLTSHDVVAVARRVLGEKRIGHTGTLDPLATGVLPLACGRATRLARFLSAADKDYEALVRFGVTTDSYDVTGIEQRRVPERPTLDALVSGVAAMTGSYLQMPPPFSAKKVGGTRAYELARRAEPVALTAVPVTVSRADLLEFDGETCRLSLTCTAGFYVRSFAHALGEQLGIGACLQSLRRTRSGDFRIDSAIDPERLQAGGSATRLFPLEALLPRLPALTVTAQGRSHVSHGRDVAGADTVGPALVAAESSGAGWVRVFDDSGALIALCTPGGTPGSFHPQIVLMSPANGNA